MRAGLIAINFAAIIFGTAALFGKLPVSPLWIVALRGAFASVALLVFGLIRGGLVPVSKKSQIAALIITGVLLAVHWLTFFASVQLAGVAIATLTFAAFPLFTVLLVAWEKKQVPTPLEIGAGIAILVAVGMLVDVHADGATLLGALSGMASAVTFAIFGIRAKSLTNELPPLTVSLVQNLIVALVLVPFLSFTSPAPQTPTEWMWLVALGVVTTALMHQLYLFALTKLSAATCSGFIALEPVYAVAFAAMFFNEPITLWVVLSGILILGASFALLRAEKNAL